jgi:RHS repeat-associated protein
VTVFDQEIDYNKAEETAGCGDPANRLEVHYAYDSDFNLERVEELGDASNPNDNRITTYTYLNQGRVRGLALTQVFSDTNTNEWLLQVDNNYTFRDPSTGAVEDVTTTYSDPNKNNLQTTFTHFNALGNVTQQRNGLNPDRTVYIFYDDDQLFPTKVYYPLGLTATTKYDPRWGTVTESCDTNSACSTATYDDFGRLKTEKGPIGATITYDYQNTGSGLDVTTSFSEGTPQTSIARYDGLGRLVRSEVGGPSSGQRIKVDYEYDAQGQLTAQSLPYDGASAVAWTTTTFDALQRPVKVTNPDETVRTTTYDGWQQVTVTDEESNDVTYTYDGLGRTVQVVEDNTSLRLVYDALDNLTDVKDKDDNHTRMVYDGLGRQTQLHDPDMGDWVYVYNSLGNLVRQTDALNQSTCIYYDLLNRPVGKFTSVLAGNGTCPPDPGYDAYQVKYYYDESNHGAGLGRRTRMVDPSGNTSWVYDQAGRILSESKVIDGHSFVTSKVYDGLGRLQSLTYPDGEMITYTYDSQGLPDRLTTTLAETVYLDNVNYNALGQPQKIELGNGGLLTIDYVYFQSDVWPGQDFRVKTVTVNNGTETLQNLNYTYDKVGNVESLSGQIGTPAYKVMLDLSYVYDDMYRLQNVSGSPYPQSRHFDYDDLGNLTGKDGLTLAYDDPQQRPHALSSVTDGINTITYQYDANGNRTARLGHGSGITTTYLYDLENRLTHVISGSNSGSVSPCAPAAFVYDGDGRRVNRNSDTNRYYANDVYEMDAPYRKIDNCVAAKSHIATTSRQYSATSIDGRAYVAWTGSSDGVLYFAKRISGTWSLRLPINTPGHVPINPVIAGVSEQGQDVLSVVWIGLEDDKLYSSHSEDGGDTWSQPVLLPKNPHNPYFEPSRQQPAIAAQEPRWDGEQAFEVVWTEDLPAYSPACHNNNNCYSILGSYSEGGLYWGFPYEYIPGVVTDTTYQAAQSDITLTYSDQAMVWRLDHGFGSGKIHTPGDIYINYKDPAFLQQDMISQGDGHAYWPRIVAWNSDLHVIWLTDDGQIHYRHWDDSLQEGWKWGLIEVIAIDLGFISDNDARIRHDIAVNDAGEVFVAWWTDDGDTFLRTRHIDGTWSEPEILVEDFNGDQVQVVTDETGAPVVLQRKGFTLNELTESSQTKHYYAGGQRIATRLNDDLYYVFGDHLGSTTVVADAAGNEVGHVVYEPYGEVFASTVPLTLTQQLFTGQILDPATGLYYYNARYYDPASGGFTQMDSLVADPLNPRAWNRSSYVYGNPANYTDSTGHVVDTFFDAADLILDAGFCMAGDTGSCGWLAYDALALAIPGMPASYGSQFYDDAFLALGGGGSRALRTGSERGAFLLGGGGFTDEAVEQILELSRHYDNITVIDAKGSQLRELKLAFELNEKSIPSNVNIPKPTRAVNLGTLKNKDIFVVAPDNTWIRSTLADDLNNIVGPGSRAYVVTEFSPNQLSNVSTKLERIGHYNNSRLGISPIFRIPDVGLPPGVTIYSQYFRGHETVNLVRLVR